MDIDTPQQANKESSSSGNDGQGDAFSSTDSKQAQDDTQAKPPSASLKSEGARDLHDRRTSSPDEMADVGDASLHQSSALQKPSPHSAEVGATPDQEQSCKFEKDLLINLQEAIQIMTDRLHTSHVEREILENAILPYQQKLTAALRELEDLKRTSDAQPTCGKEALAEVQSELSFATMKMDQLRNEKIELEHRLAKRDDTIANDASELALLREKIRAIPELQSSLTETKDRCFCLEKELAEVKKMHSARDVAAEHRTRSLEAENVLLSAELAKANRKTGVLEINLTTMLEDAKERAFRAISEATQLKTDHVKMQQYIDKIESQLSDTRASANELNKTFEDEISNMNKMLELNEQRANEAESRARDLMEELKQERELTMKREKRRLEKKSLVPHAETLLVDMEVALEAKWAALEAQKTEMERARKSEMSLLAAQEKLKKQKIDAQFLAEQQRRECVRLTRQVDLQADEIERLKQLLDRPKEVSHHPLDSTDAPRPDTAMEVSSPGFWRNSSERDPPNGAMDIGLETKIPTHYFPSPSNQSPGDYQSSIRQLSAIRREHQHLLESLRGNRISFG